MVALLEAMLIDLFSMLSDACKIMQFMHCYGLEETDQRHLRSVVQRTCTIGKRCTAFKFVTCCILKKVKGALWVGGQRCCVDASNVSYEFLIEWELAQLE